MKQRQGFMLMLFLALTVGLDGSGQTMSLKDCIASGIENNRSLLNAGIEVSKGRTAVSQNRSRLLPTVSGEIRFTDYLRQPVNVTTGTLLGNDFPDDPTWQTIKSMQYNAVAGVQLSMPLFNGAIYADIDVARTIERLSTIAYDKAVEDLTIQIAKVYYLAQSSLEQARLMKENISRMQALCDITGAMYEQGVVMEVDLSRAKVSLRNLEARQDQFEMLYATQINMLRFLLDLSPETPLDVERMADEIESFCPSGVSEWLPELRVVEMQKELAGRKIRAVKAGYLPSLSLTGYVGGLAYQDRFSHFFHTKDASRNWFGNCFLGINISIPIFDANSKKLKMRQYRYEAEQVANNACLLRDRLNRDCSNALLQLNHSLEVYRTQSQSYRQALDVYNVTEEQYREGISSMTAIIQDEMQLRTSQTACVEALCQFNLARLDLLRLSGNLSLLTE